MKKRDRQYKTEGYRWDLGHRIQNFMEANTARVFIHKGRAYEYREHSYPLENSRMKEHTPDFVLSDGLIVDVLGRFDHDAEGVRLFLAQYPELKIYVLHDRRYYMMQDKYMPLIKSDNRLAGWETPRRHVNNSDKFRKDPRQLDMFRKHSGK